MTVIFKTLPNWHCFFADIRNGLRAGIKSFPKKMVLHYFQGRIPLVGKKIVNKRKRFPQDRKEVLLARKSVSTSMNCHLRISKASAKLWMKKRLFPLDRKSVSTSWNEEHVKKYISTWRKSCFHNQEHLKNGKKLFFTSQKNSFY